MSDIFTPVDVQTPDEDVLKALAEKFGVQVTPETEKILRSKAESDSFIERLKKEADELRQEVSSKATIDEILTEIRRTSQPPQQPSPNPGQNEPAKIENSAIEELVNTLLTKKELKSKVETNRKIVQDKLQEKWGADAQLQLNKKAKELGVDVGYLGRLAEENPAVFFTAVGLNQTGPQAQPLTAPPSRTQAPNPGSSTRNKAYYEKLKATNRTEYFSAKVQNQMYKDAMAMGEAFYS